jgi:hypothetical protein
MNEGMQAILGISGWWWLIIVIITMAIFGAWPKVWEWAKKLIGMAGGTVSTSIDAQVTSWLTTAKSTKVQAMLRLCQNEFEGQGDEESTKTIDALIAKAAGWKEKKDATTEAAK